jgi:protein disulfide-isomerase A1
MVYVFAPTERERQALRKVLYKFAKNHYDSLTSATVDPFVFPDLMAQLGLEPGVFPAGAVHQLSKDRIYHYPKGRSLSASALQEWGLDVYQGRIKPWTPLGVTTTYEKAEATRTATRRVSIKNIPEVKIRVAGRDEL